MGSAFFVSCLGLRRLLGDNLAVHVKMVSGSLDFRQWLQDDHLDAQGSLFVASRRGNAVYRYRADEVPSFEGVVMEHLKDHPEFLKLLPTQQYR